MGQPLAEHLLDLVAARAVPVLFAIPDPCFLGLLLAAEARGIPVVAPHHEAAGGFMAEAAARMSGRPAFCLVSPGPGAANVLPAVVSARVEQAPVVFLIGQRAGAGGLRPARGRFQLVDHLALLAPAAKHVARLDDAAHAPAQLAEALALAVAGTPGPVCLEVPADVLAAMAGASSVPPAPVPPLPDAAALAAATSLIAGARQPVILAGHGVQTARAGAALADLARAMAAPVVLTPGAGGVAPGLEAHSFPYGFSPVAAEIVAASDVVLAVGTQLGEQVHFGQGRHWRAGDGQRRWIHIEQDGPAIGGNRPIDVALAGDLAAILPQLSGRLARAAGADLARWSAAEAARRAALAQGPSAGAGPLHPARLVVEATRALPQEAILVRDGGAFVLFQLAYGQGHPRDVLWSQNLAHLGTGLPYAIGAAQATGGQRPVVLLTSDSALLFHIAELETAARLGLPILCVVAVDHQWGLEAGMYRRLHGPATPEPGAHWSRDVRFDRIARGLACPASQVTQAQEIAPAMAAALAAGGPYLLHVPIDAAANAGEIPAFAEFASWYAQA